MSPNDNSVRDLTEGEPARLIFFFTLPLLAGNIFQQLYGFIDTLIVGRFLGVNALAAVGCTGPLMFLMLGFVMGLTSGFSIYTGQRFGAKDEAGIRKSVAACTILSVISALILSFIGVFFCRELLELMETPPEIIDGAYSFIVIIYGGMSAFVMIQMQSNLIRALGNSKMPTIIQAVTLCINIILEPIAIIVLNAGIPGAAMATIFALITGNIICFMYIKKRVPILHTHREDWRLTKEIVWQHIRIGLPMGFQSSIIAIGAVVLQFALNNLGATAVAAYAAAHRVDGIAVMPMMSFGIAIAAYTAQNFGARKFARIAEGVKKCIYMSCSFSIAVAIFNILFGADIMYMFVGEGQEQIIEYGQTFLVINGVCYWILSLLFIFRCTLQGLGQSVVPTIAGAMELIMRVIAAIFLVDMFGYIGACLSNPLAWIGACIPLSIAFFMTRKELRKFHAEEYKQSV
ncbi:MAG: MATE family efflux transporter [Selenomonadaceae bacterium]|nr:MATE family efflux transporter [Selenomonadaceae bacterium]